MSNISAISVPRTKHNVDRNVVFGWVCVRKLRFAPSFKWGSCYSIFSFICVCCRSLYILLSSFFWPLCCLSFHLPLRYLQTLLTEKRERTSWTGSVNVALNKLSTTPNKLLLFKSYCCLSFM